MTDKRKSAFVHDTRPERETSGKMQRQRMSGIRSANNDPDILPRNGVNDVQREGSTKKNHGHED